MVPQESEKEEVGGRILDGKTVEHQRGVGSSTGKG